MDNALFGLRYDYPLDAHSVVVDFGGYKGEWAQKIWDKYGCHIYIFEPLEEFFEQAKEKFRDNPKVHLYDFGISDADSTELISIDGLSSSQFVGERKVKVEFRDVSKVLKELDLKKINLLKINIEGGEFKVLPRMIQEDLINICDDLQIQFHHFYPNSEKLRDEIRKSLLITHHLSYDYPFFFENYRKNI
jgi:FkbM family methyltransferase